VSVRSTLRSFEQVDVPGILSADFRHDQFLQWQLESGTNFRRVTPAKPALHHRSEVACSELFHDSKATTGSARNLRRLLRELRPWQISNCPLSTTPVYGHLSFLTVATPGLTVLSDPTFRRQYSYVRFEVLLMSLVIHRGAEANHSKTGREVQY